VQSRGGSRDYFTLAAIEEHRRCRIRGEPLAVAALWVLASVACFEAGHVLS
jgi:hypothetical protein